MVMRFSFIIFMVVGFLSAQNQANADPVTDLAKQALDIAQPNSFKNNIEYCGLIGYHMSGALLFSPPIPGFRNSCNPGLNPWAWREVVATYHTHGAHTFDSDAEVPSLEDLLADFAEGTDGYIATPGGRVWHVSVEDKKAYMLCDVDCIRSDENYTECEGLKPAKEYTLKTLKRRIDTDDAVCE